MFEGKKMPQGLSPEQIAAKDAAMARARGILDGSVVFDPIRDIGGPEKVNDLAHDAAMADRKDRTHLRADRSKKIIKKPDHLPGARGNSIYHERRTFRDE